MTFTARSLHTCVAFVTVHSLPHSPRFGCYLHYFVHTTRSHLLHTYVHTVTQLHTRGYAAHTFATHLLQLHCLWLDYTYHLGRFGYAAPHTRCPGLPHTRLRTVRSGLVPPHALRAVCTPHRTCVYRFAWFAASARSPRCCGYTHARTFTGLVLTPPLRYGSTHLHTACTHTHAHGWLPLRLLVAAFALPRLPHGLRCLFYLHTLRFTARLHVAYGLRYLRTHRGSDIRSSALYHTTPTPRYLYTHRATPHLPACPDYGCLLLPTPRLGYVLVHTGYRFLYRVLYVGCRLRVHAPAYHAQLHLHSWLVLRGYRSGCRWLRTVTVLGSAVVTTFYTRCGWFATVGYTRSSLRYVRYRFAVGLRLVPVTTFCHLHCPAALPVTLPVVIPHRPTVVTVTDCRGYPLRYVWLFDLLVGWFTPPFTTLVPFVRYTTDCYTRLFTVRYHGSALCIVRLCLRFTFTFTRSFYVTFARLRVCQLRHTACSYAVARLRAHGYYACVLCRLRCHTGCVGSRGCYYGLDLPHTRTPRTVLPFARFAVTVPLCSCVTFWFTTVRTRFRLPRLLPATPFAVHFRFPTPRLRLHVTHTTAVLLPRVYTLDYGHAVHTLPVTVPRCTFTLHYRTFTRALVTVQFVTVCCPVVTVSGYGYRVLPGYVTVFCRLHRTAYTHHSSAVTYTAHARLHTRTAVHARLLLIYVPTVTVVIRLIYHRLRCGYVHALVTFAVVWLPVAVATATVRLPLPHYGYFGSDTYRATPPTVYAHRSYRTFGCYAFAFTHALITRGLPFHV